MAISDSANTAAQPAAVRENPEENRIASGRTRAYIAIIVTFWLLIYGAGLWTPPLLDDADSVHAEAAREMMVTGDYVTLHANGVRYLDKAPLPYWITAFSYRIFGVSEFSTRLPLALGVLALLLSIYWIGKVVYSETAGLCAALVVVTAVGPYIFTRFFIPDIIIGLWLALGCAFFLRALREPVPSRLSCWGFAAAAAAGVLTKGLIGMVFPIGIVVVYLLMTGNLRFLLRLRVVSSTLVFLALAMPWHVLAALRNPPQGASKGFLWFYFLNEQFYRYLNKRFPHDYDKVPLLLFYGLMLVWAFPWSVFLPQALKLVPHRLGDLRGNLSESQRATLLFTIWAIVILGFFTFSTRQEYYVIPAVPAVALIVGRALAREAESSDGSRERRAGIISVAVLCVIGCTAAGIAIGLAIYAGKPAPGTNLADLLVKDPSKYALSFGHFFDLTARAMTKFYWELIVVGGALLAGTVAAWVLRRRRLVLASNVALAAMMVAILACAHSALKTFLPILGSKELAVAIQREYKPGELLVCDGELTKCSTVNFYTGVQLHLLNGRVNDMWFGSTFPDAPRIFDTDETFRNLWTGPQRVYFITDDRGRADWLNTMAAPYELTHSGGKYIFVNRR